MKLLYKDPGYWYSIKSISQFVKGNEFSNEAIFHFFPELTIPNDSVDKINYNENLIDVVLKRYSLEEKEIQSKVISYQESWNRYESVINKRFSMIFQLDTTKVFNDLVCNITLNPISPRYLKEHVFDVFYMNSGNGSIGSALHELAHYLWFYLWNKKFEDSYEQYESSSLIWILSEAVVEQILNDKEFNKINPYYKTGNAYPYFYEMKIKGRLFYDYLDELYKNNTIDKFMDKSYQFMIDNEEEIRRQMPI